MTQREPHPAVATHGRTEAALGTRRPARRNSRPPRGKGVLHYSTRNIALSLLLAPPVRLRKEATCGPVDSRGLDRARTAYIRVTC